MSFGSVEGLTMVMNHELIDSLGKEVHHVWDWKDVALYSLSVGAGHDPEEELQFTTEGVTGTSQKVLPTFGTIIASAPPPEPLGESQGTTRLAVGTELRMHRTLPVAGTATAVSRLTSIDYKRRGALVEYEINAHQVGRKGTLLCTVVKTLFIVGESGEGLHGQSVASGVDQTKWSPAVSRPEHTVRFSTRPEQALLYRLTGDTNPLHADPSVAQKGGFDRPILHGQCLFGFAGRALLGTLGDFDPARLSSLSARYVSPVYPGEELEVRIWLTELGALFQVVGSRQNIVLDKGHAVIAQN